MIKKCKNIHYYTKYDFQLTNDISSYKNNAINLCVRKINTHSEIAFTQILLVKNNDEYFFPTLKIKEFDDHLREMKLCIFNTMKLSNYEQFQNEIEFEGYYVFKKKVYAIFEYIPIINLFNIENTYTFAILDELINYKQIFKNKISHDICAFCVQNNSICILYDSLNSQYEQPIIAVVQKNTLEELKYSFYVGIHSKNINSTLGAFYYFNYPEYNRIYENSTQYITNGGIIRYALFLHNTLYIENIQECKQIDIDCFSNEKCDSVINLNEFTNYNNKWWINYNSLHLGHNIIVNKNGQRNKTPIIVVKCFTQYIALGYCFIE